MMLSISETKTLHLSHELINSLEILGFTQVATKLIIRLNNKVEKHNSKMQLIYMSMRCQMKIRIMNLKRMRKDVEYFER